LISNFVDLFANLSLILQNDRPIYPQKILKTEILSNPFDDIEPRVLKNNIVEERTKKKQKKGVKYVKKTLL
jgi:peptidyl-prolyl cis-trans isomerase SDCCAG10